MLDIVGWQLSGIFAARTVFCNVHDKYLLILGNSSCVKSIGGLKNPQTQQKLKTNMHHFPANYYKGKMANTKKQNLLYIFYLLIGSVFLIDLGVASGSVSVA